MIEKYNSENFIRHLFTLETIFKQNSEKLLQGKRNIDQTFIAAACINENMIPYNKARDDKQLQCQYSSC